MSSPTFQKPKYQLNIKINSTFDELYNHYNNFTQHHNGDSGIDIFNEFYTCEHSNSYFLTIDFNIACEMIDLDTNEFCSYMLVPRSSFSNSGFIMGNSIGIIDAGYRGNLKAKIVKVTETCVLNKGSYFQIIAPDLKPIKVNIVTELSETTRASGGFGSTNK